MKAVLFVLDYFSLLSILFNCWSITPMITNNIYMIVVFTELCWQNCNGCRFFEVCLFFSILSVSLKMQKYFLWATSVLVHCQNTNQQRFLYTFWPKNWQIIYNHKKQSKHSINFMNLFCFQYELIYKVFGSHQFKKITANLELFLRRFNEVQYWIVTEMLLTQNVSKRVMLLRKFIKLAAQ